MSYAISGPLDTTGSAWPNCTPTMGTRSFGDTATITDLGKYMDEVNRAVGELLVAIEHDQKFGQSQITQHFLGWWSSYLWTFPHSAERILPAPPEIQGGPRGWASFYYSERDFLSRLGEVTDLWGQTADYESELIRFYDWAKKLGIQTDMKRPRSGYDAPTDVDRLLGFLRNVAYVGIAITALYFGAKLLEARPELLRPKTKGTPP